MHPTGMQSCWVISFTADETHAVVNHTPSILNEAI